MKASESISPTASPVALVTGGSRGIGAAICRELASQGARVLVAARSQDACVRLAEELSAAGHRAWPLELDVGEPSSIQRAASRAAELTEEFGGVGWLVNNAGIAESAPLDAPPGEGAEADLYERHLRVNFHGARLLTEALLPSMRERGYGRVVNVASSAGLRGYAYVAAYCASKFALVGYTLSAALELERAGLTFNAVCPHYVDSPMLEASIQRLMKLTGKSHAEARGFFQNENPGGQLVTPQAVASAVSALLQGGANGRLVELDGSPRPKFLHPNTQGAK